jgi:hypothetical protein
MRFAVVFTALAVFVAGVVAAPAPAPEEFGCQHAPCPGQDASTVSARAVIGTRRSVQMHSADAYASPVNGTVERARWCQWQYRCSMQAALYRVERRVG